MKIYIKKEDEWFDEINNEKELLNKKYEDLLDSTIFCKMIENIKKYKTNK